MQPNLNTLSQNNFANTLLNANLPVPDGVVDTNGVSAPKRFSVYRNNVIVSLVDAMCDAFPAIVQITGLEFFRAVAREFVSLHPPKSPLMMFYGAGFEDFLAQFGPTLNMPFLPDIARIELASRVAYHAKDQQPLTPQSLASISPEELDQTVFDLHPSVAFVSSKFPATDIWHVGKGKLDADKIPQHTQQTTLICRPELEVLVETISPVTAKALMSMKAGATFGEAVDVAMNKEPSFDLSGFISLILRLGLLAQSQTTQTKEFS